MTYRILIVDDEPQIHRFLKPSLTAAGYGVITAANGREALKSVAQHAPDAVVLDLGLPDMDGKHVIAEVREWSKVPILVLSARDRESEKIEALDLGANDYINKPFGVGELMARLRAALRHREQSGGSPNELSVGPIVMDMAAHSVLRSGNTVHLTPKEFDLLAMLLRNRGRVITHRQLLTSVWGPAHTEDLQYLRVFIGQLRQKLEADPEKPRIIVTETGIGYRIMPEEP
jgi:two-component system, OmpR family, KDP operon response regulator KdpE